MSKYAAIIVETREHPDLVAVIQNHLDYLPEGWELIVVGSSQNKPVVMAAFPNCIFREIDYFDFLRNHGPLPHITANQYNRLLTHIGFWQWLSVYERVLVFQHDSTMLRTGITDYLQYDFIGAPLYHIPFPHMNGGLSIRNPKAMLNICSYETFDESKHGNEDIFFTKILSRIGGRLPSKETAMKFSVETIFYPTPIGCHAPEKWLKQHELKQLFTT